MLVNFGPGQTSTTVTVDIQNDNFMEPNESFFGRLQSTGVEDVQITQDTAEVTIVNDDGMCVLYSQIYVFLNLQNYYSGVSYYLH